ncbi:hypothetical protein HOO54_14560 [Bacillus sp. WMMC1349]|uniref:hypothetical protein n=1 Tax=Bacillus sp. WMMC1349 TaxID=2736254 RepID=UPI0015516A1F|nr:hypothetical protein [Bacillus sp. WMMC1349]NPC93423.1 hypothetical protein [Bacillus sp. WMMC1349]
MDEKSIIEPIANEDKQVEGLPSDFYTESKVKIKKIHMNKKSFNIMEGNSLMMKEPATIERAINGKQSYYSLENDELMKQSTLFKRK